MFSDLFYIISISFIGIYLFSYFFQTRNNKKYQLNDETFKRHDITVIIPFRNEEKNLPQLIKSINKLIALPPKFVFIDDHSEDESRKCFNDLNSNIRYELLVLNKNEKGKKQAIRKALLNVETDYFLTWDADITVPSDYFIALEKITQSDLVILPVIMKSKKISHFFYELDYYFINAISYGLSPILRPIVASGANLLINKAKFNHIDSYENHKLIASGDDMFTLVDFKNNNFGISNYLNSKLAVSTYTPLNFKEFIHQRCRWSKKTIHVRDLAAICIGFLGLFIQLSFLFALFFEKNSFQFFMLFIVKFCADFLILFPYCFKIRRVQVLLFLPLFSIIQPIYLLFLPVVSIFIKPQWKNRT